MPKPDLSGLPLSMQSLPVAPKLGLPVPVVNTYDGGVFDFTAVNGPVVFEVARSRVCGICGFPMVGHVAFLGGPKSAETRAYTDPPMHPDCAMASTRLCPHIARRDMRRATDNHVMEGATVPDQMVEDKPAAWVLYVTTNYSIAMMPQSTGGVVAVFQPEDPVEQRVWVYDDAGALIRTQ